MRTAVYNAHWTTLGGGEQLAGGLAAALARSHDVDLLVNHSFDAVVASERLGFDLTGFPQVEIDYGTRAFLEVSERYDLLANTSFSSTFPSRAGRSFYYVHFPIPNDLATPKATERWRVLTPAPLRSWIEQVDGFWLPEFAGTGMWTRGTANMDLIVPEGLVLPFRFDLSAHAWPPGRQPQVRATVDGTVLYEGTVGRKRTRVRTTVTGRGSVSPVTVSIESDTFVPRIEVGSDDDRELGVVVSHAYLGRRLPSVLPRDVEVMASVPHAGAVHDFLDSYEAVVANSGYTAQWIERLWDREAIVVAPPVRPRAPGDKERIILAVGRFFPNVSGHSKKQLELVEAFRIACERGLEGWELHLAGGCSDAERGYVETVRHAAVGLPVRFHVNARGEDLAALFAGASLFWHGAGLGEDPTTNPDRFEHFGISVVEAMSAGAVPMVYEHGGPAAILEGADCGVTYSTIEDLATQTLMLVRDPAEVRRRSDAAVRRAGRFTFDAFAEQVERLVDRLEVLRPPTAARVIRSTPRGPLPIDQGAVDRAVVRMRTLPIHCPACGNITAATRFSENLRESGLCRHCGATNRNRQLAFVASRVATEQTGHPIESLAALGARSDLVVYNTESRGALHDQLARMPGYRCSEYFGPDHAAGELVGGVAHEDLTDLSFADASIDQVLSSDVLEHVPDPYRAHAEVHRVLRPNGHHIFTVPFHPHGHSDSVRARIGPDGVIEHLAEPIYHDDPVGVGEVLVFTIFGPEMLDRLAAIGFSTRMYHLWKPWRGIVGPDAFVFDAAKRA